MADVKVTALTELTEPTGDDLLYVVDSPSGSPQSRKASIVNVVDMRYLGVRLKDPTTQSWSWVNQGTSTITETNQRCYLVPQAGANAYSHRIRVKTAPTPPYTISALISAISPPNAAPGCGLLFRESSSGKLHCFTLYHTNSNVINVYSRKMTSATALSGDYANSIMTMPNPLWMRIADDNTNRVLSFSPDGFSWADFHSIGRTDFLTADQVGFFVDPYSVWQWPVMSVLGWNEA